MNAELLAALNTSQLAAVEWQDGPLLVLAGPGSGKTRVLTLRIARLIGDTPDARFRVLAITFTNKAATEMRTRIDALLQDGRERAVLTTFHAFAAELLRQHGSHVGLRPDFVILTDQADREAVLTDAIRAALPQGSDFAPMASQVLPAIARLLDECVEPDAAEARLARNPRAAELAAIYRAYRSQLVEANQMDFGTLLATAVDLLERTPAVARQVRRVYSFVCVDEFQDTNSAQFRLLVQLVSQTRPNLFVVADDDQLIYEWNGAKPERLEALRTRFDMDRLQLPENFRCPPAVIEAANNLIGHNSDRAAGKKPLVARKAGGTVSAVVVHHASDFAEEVRWVAAQIARLSPGDRSRCVILARRKRLLEGAITSLQAAAVPAYIAVRKNEFESVPYRWLQALLRLANARQDREQVRRLSRTFYKLEGTDVPIEDVVANAAVNSADLLTAWVDTASSRSGLSVIGGRVLSAVRGRLIDHMDYPAATRAAHEWFLAVRSQPGGAIDATFDGFDDEAEIWRSLVEDIASHGGESEMSLATFLQQMDLRAKEKPVPAGAVRCLTIHAAKGMEFRDVFLVGLVEDELPSWAATKKGTDSAEIREERRNCFVAITRAEESLTLTYADEYFGYSKSPSRFLREMGVL
jgi:DNA helicase-2/ATP-dependent DNA helicase PcrA